MWSVGVVALVIATGLSSVLGTLDVFHKSDPPKNLGKLYYGLCYAEFQQMPVVYPCPL